eukprot:COSAG06_NODE_43151_length_374_cov_3.567273_1_plen_47_part_10
MLILIHIYIYAYIFTCRLGRAGVELGQRLCFGLGMAAAVQVASLRLL